MQNGEVKFHRLVISNIFFFVVRFTKRLFMMQDGTCRYTPTCSQYSKEALQVLPLYKAIPKIIKRVSSCHPHGGFGFDPVIKDEKKKEKE